MNDNSGNIATGPYSSTHDSDYNTSDDDSDPTKPWLAEFERYLATHDVVPEDMLIVEWWGVSLKFILPSWTAAIIETHTWLFS